MARYSTERKAAVLAKMMPPLNMSISQLSEQEGISEATLYNWRVKAKEGGSVVPGNGKNPEQWSGQQKFAAVLETANLNSAELAEYCRKKGLFAEQIESWRAACISGNDTQAEQMRRFKEQGKADKKQIRQLERELHRKEKALAETAALLVLRKKLNAILGEKEDE